MNNKELWMIGVGSVTAITTIVTGAIYLVKTRNKKNRLKEGVAILEASRENKSWWLTKECQGCAKEIIFWVKGNQEASTKLKEELETIKTKHWMTKDYQTAFWKVYDYAKERI